MRDERIESIDMEKDPGVHIHKSLKVKEQVNYVIKKANRILGTIVRACAHSRTCGVCARVCVRACIMDAIFCA